MRKQENVIYIKEKKKSLEIVPEMIEMLELVKKDLETVPTYICMKLTEITLLTEGCFIFASDNFKTPESTQMFRKYATKILIEESL